MSGGGMRRSIFLFTLVIVIVFLFAGTSNAYTTYVIKKGDNPYDIAKKFKVKPQDIIKANNLAPRNLKPGVKITIPSNMKDCSPQNKHTKEKDAKLVSCKEKSSVHKSVRPVKLHEASSVHAVKKGDTLSAISKKYSVPVDELKEINNLRSAKLKIGQQIIVKQIVKQYEAKNYTVRKGDTIWSIARKYDLDPDELMEINSLETDALHIGQKILLNAETETKEQKTYEAILSQSPDEHEMEKVTASEEISKIGTQDRLILFAKKLLDIPYRFGGNSLLGIDCSAYVKKVYSLIGIDLPRSARQQFEEGMPVDANELSIGDLVFFRTYASFPSHVGIYLGNNLFIHASSRSKKVTIDSLDTPYYIKRFIGAKRLLEGNEAKDESGAEG